MDKLLRRVRMAERQVVRRAKREKYIQEKFEQRQQRHQMLRTQREAGEQLKAAIVARHEDWELGPLAPRRDVSRVDKFGNYWGSITGERAQLSTTQLTDEQKTARSAWAGGPQYICLAPGDRVVILEGPYRGKITKIEKINKENMTIDVADEMLVSDAAFLHEMCRVTHT